MEKWDELTKTEFAEFVMNMRKAAGLSREDFAEKVGLTPTTIKRYEDPSKKSMPADVYAFQIKIREVCLPIIRAKRGVK
jgi:ribosome-binding protein aMBF1 (putative translation factor)